MIDTAFQMRLDRQVSLAKYFHDAEVGKQVIVEVVMIVELYLSL